MKRLLINIVTVFTVLLLNTFGLAIHASAMPMASHEMGGISNETDSSANCATLCRTAVINKEEAVNPSFEEQDDEPVSPYYVLFQGLGFYNVDTMSRLYAATVKPPPKIPIYILYAVFRV